MATITASYTVIPKEPTPKHRMWLSESDQMVPWTHATNIYIYKTSQNHHYAIERLRNSLSMLLVHYYPLAGRLRWIEGGSLRVELDCNSKGVKLLEAESTKTLENYEAFSPNKETIKELIPAIDYTQPIEELPLFLAQLTRFNNEGLAIGIAISHPLVDGYAAICFINTWAKLSRGDTLDPDEIFPFLDRTILKYDPNINPSPPRFHHPEFKPLPLILGCSNSMNEQKKETTTALLKITSEQMEKLKKKTNDDESRKEEADSSRPYSKYESITTHIWRCVSKARQLDEHQPTVLRVTADIRKRLNPPLPQNYFGNAVLPTLTPLCHVGDIISKPLSYVARKIRESIEMLTNEYIRSQLDFLTSQKQLGSTKASFYAKGDHVPIFRGNPNLHIVSWMSMPVHGADFGWGKPIYFGPGVVVPDGKAYIMLSPNEDGSVIVAICLQIAHMEHFNKFFYEDI